jgi:hypothetical protein
MRTCLAIFLLLGALQLLFPVTAKCQNIATEKVALGLKDESLEVAIKKIEQQTTLRFFYHNGDVTPLAHLNLITGSRTIQQTLEVLLQNTNLSFRQMGNNILLERREQPAFYEISGRVADSADRSAVANASVFINNSTVGCTTDSNGSFKLNITTPGKYEIVVSIIGYGNYKKALFIDNNIALPTIVIASRTVKLSEVKVTTDPNWDRNFKLFNQEFLGRWNFPGKCVILNPEVLDLNYDEKTGVLTASSPYFLEIENEALGYKLKYLLTKFSSSKKSGKVTYKGSVWFENLTGDQGWQQLWQRNRNKAYKGSMMHFLRAALENQLAAEGFEVLRLKRLDFNEDNSVKYIETLGKTYLQADDFVKLTNKRDVYALSFKDRLYVMYTKIHNYKGNLATIPLGYQPSYAKTSLVMVSPYTFFDNNGIIMNPESIAFEGYWADSRVAEILPSDYSPDN